MGTDESRRLVGAVDQRTPHLPRYIIEHIGQILRNRYREDLLIPVSGEMLAILQMARKGGPQLEQNGKVPRP
jgi:hypothetical protein